MLLEANTAAVASPVSAGDEDGGGDYDNEVEYGRETSVVASPSASPAEVCPPHGVRCRIVSSLNGMVLGVRAPGKGGEGGEGSQQGAGEDGGGVTIKEGSPVLMASAVAAANEEAAAGGGTGGGGDATSHVQPADEDGEYFTVWDLLPLRAGMHGLVP